MTLFEKFDQIEARFSKIFAGIVLCLVAALIVVDILGAALRDDPPSPSSSGDAKDIAKARDCQIMPGGIYICDVLPPRKPN